MFFKKYRRLKLTDLKSLKDLESQRFEVFKIDKDMKARTSILIIDDEGFNTDTLKSIGYTNIHKKFKHDNINDYQTYNIILCDINNIARELDEKYQGAALAKTIKDEYPDKIVVIYSSQAQSAELNKFYKEVDDVINKDISPMELHQKLDNYIEILNNPIYYWRNARKALLNKDISPINISLLEHYYVLSILEKDIYRKEINQIKNEISIVDVANMISSILNVLAAIISRLPS